MTPIYTQVLALVWIFRKSVRTDFHKDTVVHVVDILIPGSQPINRLRDLAPELSAMRSYPETGLEEINTDFLEADIWPA